MEKIIGKDDKLQLNKSDVYVINDSMGIVYLKGIKKGDRIYYQKEGNKINEVIEELSKKKIRVLVQGYGTVEGGTAEGTRYKEGEKVTLIAKAQTKTINEVEYTSEFKGWYLDGKLQSTDTTYVIEVTKDATYTAIFDMEPTLIYYLDSNSEEQILVTKEATINSTTYTDAGIDKTQITKVVFGSTCTNIGEAAFYECTNLTNVIAETTNKIAFGAWCFKNCSNLTKIKATNASLPLAGPFENCTNLIEAELGSKEHMIESIGSHVTPFTGANNPSLVIKIYMDRNAESEKSLKTNNVATIIQYSSNDEENNIVIGLKYRGTDIAWKSLAEFEEIKDVNKITEIRENSFDGCTELQLETLPNSIETIGANAFRNCKKIVIGAMPTNCTSIGRYAFENCSGITQLEINTTNTVALWGWCFKGCNNLTTVKATNVRLPETGPFQNCTNLIRAELGSKEHMIKSIGSWVTPFTGANNPSLVIKIYMDRNAESEKSLKTNNVATIIQYSSNDEENNIVIGLKYRGTDIAWKSLAEFEEIKDVNKITEIRENSFDGCTELQLETLPNSIETIGANAFRNCKKIVIGAMPTNCTSIGRYAFENCSGITQLEINTTNTVALWGWCFKGCNNLTTVKATNVRLPETGPFQNCINLSKAELGSKEHMIKSIGSHVTPFTGVKNSSFEITVYMEKGDNYNSSIGSLKSGNNANIIVLDSNGTRIN